MPNQPPDRGAAAKNLVPGRALFYRSAMSYGPHHRLTDPARPRAELWRLVLGVCLALFVMLSLSRMVFTLARMLLDPDAYRAFADTLLDGTTPATLLILLGSMGFMGIGALVAARLIHHRSARSLFGPGALSQGLRVAGAMIVLTLAVALLPPWDTFTGTTRNLPFGLWLMLLPLSLTALLIQTGAEELFFRGYLQSQLAARFKHPVVWLTIPSALFALGHHAPAMFGDNALYVTLWAFAFGVAMADLTARSGSLGPAIAIHLVNNATAILLVSMQGELSGLALYHLPFGPGDSAQIRAVLPVDLALLGLSWLTARVALRV